MNLSGTRKKRNGEIELLRFLFSLVIVLHHSRFLPGGEGRLFVRGSFSVEFFFIVSGYLMMASIRKAKKNVSGASLGEETFSFLKKKVKALYPEVAVSWVIALIFYVITNTESVTDFLRRFVCSFFNDLLLLKMTRVFEWPGFNGVVWYVSAMLLCMAILYPLLRRYTDVMAYCIIPAASLLIIGLMMNRYGAVNAPDEWFLFTYKGNWRAFAEIGLGVVAYEITRRLNGIELKIGVRALFTAIKLGAYLTIFAWMFISRFYMEPLCIMLMMAAVIITFSEKGIDSGIYNNKLCHFLGRFSLPLYLSHSFYAQRIGVLLPESWGFGMMLVVYLVCSLITAAIVMAISSLIRKSGLYNRLVRLIREDCTGSGGKEYEV